MIPTRVIEAKRDGRSLGAEELAGFLRAYLREDVAEYQMAALLMAVYFRGLDRGEVEVLVRSMLESGASLDLSRIEGPCVDKHSTGGVGDKVSLALAPLVACTGVHVPMMAGRGLGHTTGTIDKLEAIPGFRTRLDLDDFVSVLESVGCAIMAQSEDIAPLDRRLYALRDVTGTVPAIPLIAASIMSKKLAEDLDGLVLDVKVGDGAFLPAEEDAIELASLMVEIGERHGVATRALLTAMDRPLGVTIGNGLEAMEAIECLQGAGPARLRDLVLEEATEMVRLGAPDTAPAEARRRAEEALDSGAALERFVRLVEAQGGDPTTVDEPSRLATASVRDTVTAARSGTVIRVAARALGDGVVALGGGRRRVEDAIDPGVGFEVLVEPGDEVSAGDPLGVVHARTVADAAVGARVLTDSVIVGETEDVALRPLVSHRLGGFRVPTPG